MEIKNILFPTDFSACSGNALYYATNLASKLDADLLLMHSYNFPDEYSAIPAEQIFSMKNSLEKDAAGRMEVLIKETAAIFPDIHLSYDLELGFFTEQLVEKIKKRGIDLVVLATRGTDGLANFLFGTNTAKVIDISTCPVLVIPEQAVYGPIKNIMFLSKFRKEEVEQLKYISSIAKILGATIFVVHISDEQEISVDNDYVENVSMEIDYPLINFKCIKGKHIVECMEEFSLEKNIDWIVMYVSHRNILQKIFGPNLTKEVSYHTKVPLFVFPERTILT